MMPLVREAHTVFSALRRVLPSFGSGPTTEAEIAGLYAGFEVALHELTDTDSYRDAGAVAFVAPRLGGRYHVAIKGGLTERQRRHALIHELAHVVAGHVDAGVVPEKRFLEEDIVADMVALLGTFPEVERDPDAPAVMLRHLGPLWQGDLEGAEFRLVAAAGLLRALEVRA